MELLRGGEEVGRHGLEDIQRGGGDVDRQLLDLVLEVSEFGLKDGVEDADDLRVHGEGQVDEGESALGPLADVIASPAGMAHRGDQLRVQDELPRTLGAVVPALVVDPQPHQL